MTEYIHGLKELQLALSELGPKLGGSALRSAVRAAMKPALEAARAAAPIADPPYSYPTKGGGTHIVQPYPKKTYLGRLVAPGFTSRNIRMRASISKDKRTATIKLGVAPEAFYALQFLELGTSTIAKRPWLEPSFRGAQRSVLSQLSAQLKRKIELAARKRAK